MEEKRVIVEGVKTNYIAFTDGTIKNEKTGRKLKGSITPDGYKRIQLIVGSKSKSILVHRIIAECFLENPNNYKYITHINEDFSDNRIENLMWTNSIKQRKNIKVADNTIRTTKKDYDWVLLDEEKSYYICKEGYVYNSKTDRFLKGENRCGYRRIKLSNGIYSIHRLVYEIFNSPIPKGMIIDHIDGNKENNNINNLRCISQSDNMKHAYELGHKGQHPVKQYDLNHNYIKTYPSCSAAGEDMGVSYRAISSAADRGGTSCGYYWKKI